LNQTPHKALFVLPNLFTISSIFCGLYAIMQAMGDGPARFQRAAVAIVFAIIFDSLDGRVARLTKTQSDFGVQLDSLADMISFGVAPGILMWQWALSSYGWLGTFVAFGYITCGALRLARFNVLAANQSSPSKHFVGLPIPMAAAALVSLVMLHHQVAGGLLQGKPEIIGIVILLSLLMVSNVPYRTFKKLRATPRTFLFLALFVAGVVFAAFRTSFSFMFVVVANGLIAIGIAEGLFDFVRWCVLRRHADQRDCAEVEIKEENTSI